MLKAFFSTKTQTNESYCVFCQTRFCAYLFQSHRLTLHQCRTEAGVCKTTVYTSKVLFAYCIIGFAIGLYSAIYSSFQVVNWNKPIDQHFYEYVALASIGCLEIGNSFLWNIERKEYVAFLREVTFIARKNKISYFNVKNLSKKSFKYEIRLLLLILFCFKTFSITCMFGCVYIVGLHVIVTLSLYWILNYYLWTVVFEIAIMQRCMHAISAFIQTEIKNMNAKHTSSLLKLIQVNWFRLNFLKGKFCKYGSKILVCFNPCIVFSLVAYVSFHKEIYTQQKYYILSEYLYSLYLLGEGGASILVFIVVFIHFDKLVRQVCFINYYNLTFLNN